MMNTTPFYDGVKIAINDCVSISELLHVTVACSNIIVPAILGGQSALPDFTNKRPTDTEACDYARALLAPNSDMKPLIWDVNANAENGEVVDVKLHTEEQGFVVVSVWYETNDAGKRVVYGEW